MKKWISILTTFTILATVFVSFSVNAAVQLPGEFTLIYSADGNKLPSLSSELLLDRPAGGQRSVKRESLKGVFGKDESDTVIKVTMTEKDSLTNPLSSYFGAEWGKDWGEENDTVWYKSSYNGYIVCELNFCPGEEFRYIQLVTDSNAAVSNQVEGLEPGKWYHIAFVVDCDGSGNEVTQAYVNGIPCGEPRTNGALGDKKGTANEARNSLRTIVFMNSGDEESVDRVYYVDNLRYYETDSYAFNEGDIIEDFSDGVLSGYSYSNYPNEKYSNYKGKVSITGIGACHAGIGGKSEQDYSLKLNYNARDCINIIKSWENAKNPDYVGYYNAEYEIYLDPDYTEYENLGALVLTSNQGAVISDDKVTGAYLESLGEENPWIEDGWNKVSYVIECKAGGDKKTVYTYINGVQVGKTTNSSALNGNRSDIRFSIRSTQAVAPLSKTEWSSKSESEKRDYAGDNTVVNASGDKYVFENPIICYIDNIRTYESTGSELYCWDGATGDYGYFEYINRIPENGVGGKLFGDISERITEVNSEEDGVPYIEYLWGDAPKNCTDASDALSKWTKSKFEGYLVIEANIMNNGKFSNFSLCTKDNLSISNPIPASALSDRWNKITIVIENYLTDEGDVIRTSREYVNAEEIIPDVDANVMLGEYCAYDGSCANEIRLVFNRDEMGELNICVDDIRIYETIEPPVLDEPIILSDGYEYGDFGFVDNTERTITYKEGKTVENVISLVESDDARVAVYESMGCSTPMKASDSLSEGNVLIIETAGKTYTGYILKPLIYNKITLSGDGYAGGLSLDSGEFEASATVEGEGILIAAQYDSEDRLIKCEVNDDPDSNGLLSLYFTPDDIEKSTVSLMLLENTETLAPLCDALDLKYKPIDILVVGNSFSVDVSFHLREIAEAAGDSYNVAVIQKGGMSAEFHLDNAKEDPVEKGITFHYNEDSYVHKNLSEVLKEYDWDYVLVQNWGSNEEFYSTDTANYNTNWKPLVNLAKYVKNNEPNAKVMLHETWSFERGYNKWTTEEKHRTFTENLGILYDRVAEDGEGFIEGKVSSLDTVVAARAYTEDSVALFDTTYEQSKHVFNGLKHYGTKDVGNGSSLLNEADKALGKTSLHRDGFHMSATGRYLIALNAYRTLSGNAVSGNSYIPGTVSLDSAAWSDAAYKTSITAMQRYNPLTPAMCSVLQEIVDNMER